MQSQVFRGVTFATRYRVARVFPQKRALSLPLALFVAATALSGCDMLSGLTGGNSSDKSASGGGAEMNASAIRPPSQDDLNWSWATSRDVLGVNPAFAEKKLGPAKRKEKWGATQANWTFEIGGCEVKYLIEDEEVGAFTVALAQSCTPSFKGFSGLEGRVARGATFGELSKGLPGGDWRADCLGNCGEGDKSSLFYVQQGGRSSGFIAIILQAPQTGETAAKAGQDWLTAIRATGPADAGDMIAGSATGAGTTADPREAEATAEVMDDSLYRCGNAPAQDVIAKGAAGITVERITVGQRALDITGISCTAE